MDEADKVELDLKYQKKKVQNLIEGHQERYRVVLCCVEMHWAAHAIDAMLATVTCNLAR